jgi:hypothetical protein
MKTIKHFLILFLATGLFFSCSSDDDNPDPVNEEEIITTVNLVLTPVGNGDIVTFQSQDLDGDGPDAPVNSQIGSIIASTQYTASVQFLNELENPADNITLEVLEEDDEHQVFYSFTGTSGSTITYNDTDENGNPIGVSTNFSAGSASVNNTLTITLRHEPNKAASGVSTGDISNAGGETDVEVTFNFDIN